ncbi:MAG: diphosphomevalonate decarboxylase [Chloroflexi bacterium]|nr:diphosphomevalonate decarboxylase [Chloroflexota bacterium]
MNPSRSATARAHPNIAFIKYWGNADDHLRLPANPSLSMNLDGLYTETTVTWRDDLDTDQLTLNGQSDTGAACRRVSAHLDALRERLGIRGFATVQSANNFPMGTGIASSAASFAALTLAATSAAGLTLSERELSTLARLGSGSAARSIPGGYVEWHVGQTHEESFAESIAQPEYWALVDVIAVVSGQHKKVGSQEGHRTAATSDLQAARVTGAAGRLATCKAAILERNFATFAEVVEHDSNLMHAVMMTSRPPLFYWLPATLAIMEQVRQWRQDGLSVCYTLDAGPNVHCICVKQDAEQVRQGLAALSGVQEVRVAGVGGPAQRVNN